MKSNQQNGVTVERFSGRVGRFSMTDDMRVERGSKRDWDELHALHYKAESLPAGPHFWRCVTGDGDLVGVVVLSSVSLLLAPRHEVFPKLKPGKDTHFTNVARGKWLNANLLRAARIVTDTMYRGVGVSYRMVNLAMRMEGKRFIEIQSSMSKFNPFDVKAGFKQARLKQAAAYPAGMKFFRSYLEAHPADHSEVMAEIQAMPGSVRAGFEKDMREFYYKNSSKEKCGKSASEGMTKVNAMSTSQVLKELQQLVFATPVYGIWQNPDFQRKMPDSLPLTAFDLQKPDEPLRLDLL